MVMNMDNGSGREPSRVAFMLLISGYLLILVGVLMLFSALASGMTSGEIPFGSIYLFSLYASSVFYFGFGATVLSQVWYILFIRYSPDSKLHLTIFREPIFLSIFILTIVAYVPFVLDLTYEIYGGVLAESSIETGIALAPVFIFITPVYIIVFYFGKIKPQKKAETSGETSEHVR